MSSLQLSNGELKSQFKVYLTGIPCAAPVAPTTIATLMSDIKFVFILYYFNI